MPKVIRSTKRKLKIGPLGQKIILFLGGGLTLGLTHRPDKYLQIAKEIAEEWREINRRSLRESLRKLYKSKLIEHIENDDGTATLVLSDEGRKIYLRYDIEKITIVKPSRWDGLWRLIIFDIPEEKRHGRKALAEKLLELGFKPVQKSVFIYPYECRKELDFIIEF